MSRRLFPLSLLCVVAAGLVPQGAALAANTPEALAQIAERFFPDAGPGGVVLVRKGEQILLRRAYGLADVENRLAMQPESVLSIASCTKQFTAVAVLKLAEAGKLSLDEAIARWLPELPEAMGRVTVRQLLNHVSGVKNISRIAASRAARREEASLDRLIGFFKDEALEFAPGTRFSYSNSNYILLSKILEKASGKSYADYLRTALFQPAGMSHTRVGSHTALIPNRARGYQEDESGLSNAEFISMTQPAGAGALVSTVDDLNRWDLALNRNTLLAAQWQNQAFTKTRLADGAEVPYGFGWMLSELQGMKTREHSGFINGFQSYTLSLPEQSVYVTVLTNSEALSPSELSTELAALAAGRPYDKTPAERDGADAWLGRYDFGGDTLREIFRRDGKLWSQRVGGAALELIAAKDGRYYFHEGVNYLSFQKDEKGNAQAILHDRLMGDSTGTRVKG
ncbi:MAG: beta-lactamase family protein [Gammaproteobacteria bacterium]|nr:beta-lactamase family protein [Gammaproteobacteria bacterium]